MFQMNFRLPWWLDGWEEEKGSKKCGAKRKCFYEEISVGIKRKFNAILKASDDDEQDEQEEEKYTWFGNIFFLHSWWCRSILKHFIWEKNFPAFPFALATFDVTHNGERLKFLFRDTQHPLTLTQKFVQNERDWL